MALNDLCLGQFTGKNDDVILRAQVPPTNVLIENACERELVVFKDESCPTFIHRCDVTLVHANPRRIQPVGLNVEAIARCNKIYRSVASDGLELGFDSG